MTNLQSKFSIKHVIVEPIIIVALVCFLCSIITFVSIKMTEDGTPLYKTPIWTILIFGGLLIWTICYYLKTFKRYTFLDKGFEVVNIFGKEFHSWQTVKEVSLIENSFEKILWQYLQEDALLISLKNGKVLELYSKYYQNMAEIRSYINSKDNLKIINSYDKRTKNTINYLLKGKYKGDFIFSFDGFFILFFLILFGSTAMIKWDSLTTIGLLFFIGIPLLVVIIVGFKSYYFELDQNNLIIKNHVFLHINCKVKLEKVKLVYFERKFKKESSIRIVRDNYEMVSFQGGTLKKKQWKSLILKLKTNGVQVVDENLIL